MNPIGGTAYQNLIEGKPRFSAMPYTYDIAEGNIIDHVSWSKTGYNADVDVGVEDLWTYGGLEPFRNSKALMMSRKCRDASGLSYCDMQEVSNDVSSSFCSRRESIIRGVVVCNDRSKVF